MIISISRCGPYVWCASRLSNFEELGAFKISFELTVGNKLPFVVRGQFQLTTWEGQEFPMTLTKVLF